MLNLTSTKASAEVFRLLAKFILVVLPFSQLEELSELRLRITQLLMHTLLCRQLLVDGGELLLRLFESGGEFRALFLEVRSRTLGILATRGFLGQPLVERLDLLFEVRLGLGEFTCLTFQLAGSRLRMWTST